MKKKWICLLTALALAVGACAVKPVISGAAPAEPIDLTKECTLNIQPVDWVDSDACQKKWDQMKKAEVVVDLYKVAGAVKETGYDTYSFEPVDAYEDILDISDYSKLQALKAEDWDGLAQKTAGIVLRDGSSITADQSIPLVATGAYFKNLEAGLYLAVARGASENPKRSDYVRIDWKTTENENGEEAGKEIEKIYTIANSERYEFAFLPQLIALPTKEAVNGSVNTANPGEWLYTMNTVLKYEINQRYGALRIRKDLLSYETEPGKEKEVTFVFHITGTLTGTLPGEETLTCDKYESITFTGAEQKEVIVENIPAGMEVTVEEEYSGVVYKEDEAKDENDKITRKVLIVAGETADLIASEGIAGVDFRNRYTKGENPGSGIKNTFTYQNGTWNWSSDPVQSDGSDNE